MTLNPGDKIEVTCSRGTFRGTVKELLSSQFTYVDEEGKVRYAFYKDQIKVLNHANL